ncbi:MAG: hypothetical protein Q9207_006438 [Kuettlingeria erythrocarpa]
MLWRFLRHQRPLQPRQPCYRFRQSPEILGQRSLSSARNILPTVASLLALRTIDNQEATAVHIAGSVRTIRKQKLRAFLEIGDGSTVHGLQALLSPDQAQGLSTGDLVAIRGLWRPSPPGKEQTHELHAEEIEIIGNADPETTYPIQKKFQTPEFLRTIPHLRLRLPLQTLVARLRSELDFLLAQFFRDRGFLRVQTPAITSSDCEGAGEAFSVTAKASSSCPGPDPGPVQTSKLEKLTKEEELFFRKSKYLTVSAQLHLEAYMHEHPKVWTFAPTFRAEKSDTPRHVSEFWMLEAEFRTHDLEEIMGFVEDMIVSLVRGLGTSSFLEELMIARRSWESSKGTEPSIDKDLLSSRWEGLKRGSWPRITYTDAMQLLQDSGRSGESDFIHRPNWKSGMHLEHERYVAATVGRGKPVFVTNYPRAIKPFYMLPNARTGRQTVGTPDTAACFDLLLPELCEVVGGSLREHRLQPLITSMQRQNKGQAADAQGAMSELTGRSTSLGMGNNLDWYLDLRRFGSVPHGGFGLGFDRLLSYLTGIHNIKDVIPWPRHYGRCDC